jgi:hypothetical protein
VTALYQNDEALHATMAPHLSRAAFARALTALEPYGFPKADPIFKARYFPAVRAWLDKQAGLAKTAPQVRDGEENWQHAGENTNPGADRKKAENRPRSAVLERRQDHAQGSKLPGTLDPFTERRLGRGAD